MYDVSCLNSNSRSNIGKALKKKKMMVKCNGNGRKPKWNRQTVVWILGFFLAFCFLSTPQDFIRNSKEATGIQSVSFNVNEINDWSVRAKSFAEHLSLLLKGEHEGFQWGSEAKIADIAKKANGRYLLQIEEDDDISFENYDLEDDTSPPSGLCKKANNLPDVIDVHEWTSTKEVPLESLTLMTHLSVDRLSMLENQCRTWPDPLVAIVYAPLYANKSDDSVIVATQQNTTLEHVARGLDAFHMLMEATGSCALKMKLVGQLIDPLLPDEYPINTLRNHAIRMAETELVFMLDVDFVAAPYLGMPGMGYKDPNLYEQMVELTLQRRALVIPAFEITHRKQNLGLAQNFARSLIVGGKETIRWNWYKGKVDAFNGQDAPWGHGPTNTSKWIDIDEPTTYRAYYEPRYEPFLVMNKAVAPWCDERFVGYGGNKIAYINQLTGFGFSFHVHPYGFVIHVPHVRTKAAKTFVAEKHRGMSRMDDLRAQVEAEVQMGTYVPATKFCTEDADEMSQRWHQAKIELQKDEQKKTSEHKDVNLQTAAATSITEGEEETMNSQ